MYTDCRLVHHRGRLILVGAPPTLNNNNNNNDNALLAGLIDGQKTGKTSSQKVSVFTTFSRDIPTSSFAIDGDSSQREHRRER